jgi:hypothetical protein
VNNKNKFVILISVFLSLFVTTTAWSEGSKESQSEASSYLQHRSTFEANLKTLKSQHEIEKRQLLAEIKKINDETSGKQAEIQNMRSEISEKKGSLVGLELIRNFFVFLLLPFAGALSLFDSLGVAAGLKNSSFSVIQYVFLPITALNLLLYIKLKEKVLWEKYRMALMVICGVFILGFSSPLFAEESQEVEKVSESLDTALEVLGKSDHQRYIAILEGRVKNPTELPSLKSGDELLQASQKVFLNTGEYFFTLAALHSHEGQTGKAVDAIKNIMDPGLVFKSDQASKIFINSIKFLIKHKQTDSARKMIDVQANRIRDVEQSLEISKYLKENQMGASSKKVLDITISRAKSVNDLMALASFLIEAGELEKGSQSLTRAANISRKIADHLAIAKLAIKYEKSEIISNLVDSLPKSISERIQFVDLLLANGRKEDATIVFSNLTAKIRKSTPKYKQKLVYIIEQAMARKLTEQALSAVSKLSVYLGKDAYYQTMKLPSNMQLSANIPTPEKVSIPLFYGMLNEELNFNDKAEGAYIRVVLQTLENILSSYGYAMPNSFNDFHLLGNIWKSENKDMLLRKLDDVYTLIEEKHILATKNAQKVELARYRVELENAKSQQQQATAEIDSLRSKTEDEMWELSVRSFSTVLTIIFVIGVLVGCLWKGYEYSKLQCTHKAYGFVTKSLESVGWVRVMSIIGVVSGLITILIAQWLQIFQRIHEEITLPRQKTLPLNVPVASKPDNAEALRSDNRD